MNEMPKFKVGMVITAGVVELIAEIEAPDFRSACRQAAESNEDLRSGFDEEALTVGRRRLVSLDDYFRNGPPATMQ